MWIFALLFLFLILVGFLFIRRNFDFWNRRNIIQHSGSLREFIFGNRSLPEIYKDIYDSHPNVPHVGIFIGTSPALLLRDVENIQAVLAGEFQNFHQRGIIQNPDDILARNVLFTEDYLRWKTLRQKLSPVFTSAKLRNMFYLIDRCAQDFVLRISDNPKIVETPFDGLYTYTTASIAASVFGIDAQIKNTMDSPFLDMTRNALKPSLKTTLAFAIGNVSVQLLRILNLKTFGEYEDFFIGVVREVLKSRRNENNNRHDFIDMCLELQDQGTMKDSATGFEIEPTVEVLAAQAFFFFIAGADTSANTMHFTLLELSNNPDILTKVHEEIDMIFNKCNEILTYNEVEKLNYLEMVVNEAVRKYPPIGLNQRKCMKDTVLPVGGVKVEKGCLVVIPVFAFHRDAKYFPNPEVFDPERFSPENVINIPKFAYMPFGEGNRICLGMRYAKLQVKTGLAWLLRRYTLRPQCVSPKNFEPSLFAIRASDIRYDLIPRKIFN